jgi:hypothetical protein
MSACIQFMRTGMSALPKASENGSFLINEQIKAARVNEPRGKFFQEITKNREEECYSFDKE